MQSALTAREKAMLEMNCSSEALDAVCSAIPCMRSPTVNRLMDGGYAVKSVVPKKDVPAVIAACKTAGATDILEYDMRKVVP
jgi:ATP phosphoribosyltransferase